MKTSGQMQKQVLMKEAQCTGRLSWRRMFMRLETACLSALSMVLAGMARMAFAEEPADVFFVHGANVSERDAQAWSSEMFKRLWQAGANMRFHPVAWESDIGQSYNYQMNVSNAFETASRLPSLVNGMHGRKVFIAHSLGTMVVAAAIQDYGLQVDKFIMLNSAIPSEAFSPTLFDPSPSNHLVHESWTNYPSACWTSRWHEFYKSDPNDARGKLTWRGRFTKVIPVAVNFYSSGDEVLEIYTDKHNPGVRDGLNSPSGKGKRYSWHKQELWKGRYHWYAFAGTTEWSGWGFNENGDWTADKANATVDMSVFATNTVFNLHPPSISNAISPRLVIDAHLAQGIPALSPPTGRTDLSSIGIPSFDMNSDEFKPNGWPRTIESFSDLANRHLHSDVKDVAYFYVHPIFAKIVEVGDLR